MLVRLRLIGGRVSSASLHSLVEVAEKYGDGHVHVTSRMNLQVRAFPGADGQLTSDALFALEATGLLPTLTHELVRNVMVSPQTGLAGGRADLRPVASELDRLLCADERLATLPGRFLFVLDDGRGDLLNRSCDLGLVALDGHTAQLRIGTDWGPILPLMSAAAESAALAVDFTHRRGIGPTAPWHVAELPEPLVTPASADPRLPAPAGPLSFGPVPGGRHVAVPEEGLDRACVEALIDGVPEVIVTPGRGVLVPEEGR